MTWAIAMNSADCDGARRRKRRDRLFVYACVPPCRSARRSSGTCLVRTLRGLLLIRRWLDRVEGKSKNDEGGGVAISLALNLSCTRRALCVQDVCWVAVQRGQPSRAGSSSVRPDADAFVATKVPHEITARSRLLSPFAVELAEEAVERQRCTVRDGEESVTADEVTQLCTRLLWLLEGWSGAHLELSGAGPRTRAYAYSYLSPAKRQIILLFLLIYLDV